MMEAVHWITWGVFIIPNGTSLSECQYFISWHTKGHLWIEGCLDTIDEHDKRCIHYPTRFPFYTFICWLLYVTISIATRIHTWLSPQHSMYCTWVSSSQPVYRSVCRLQWQILTYNTRHAVGKVAYVRGLLIGKIVYINWHEKVKMAS